MKFKDVYATKIPNGAVRRIKQGGLTLWTKKEMRYVSFGDSIAAGHAIDDKWATDYGEKSQYGVNGNTSTVIVPGCYTDLLRKDFEQSHGKDTVELTSFARSGDTVADLIAKLDDEPVKAALARATLVTVCIGANDILGSVSEANFTEYVTTGSLAHIEAEVTANLDRLLSDGPNSYRDLFDRMHAINGGARYVFTTIYNPYKYLWIQEGTNGFFKPMLDTIPALNFFGIDVSNIIKQDLLNVDVVELLFDRMNGLCDWVEEYVSRLNHILQYKVAEFKAVNPNFTVADTKAVYDPVPDRPINAPLHYNDLVNVEYTRGYTVGTMDWGALYEPDGGALNFWTNLAVKYVSASGLDLVGLAAELIPPVVLRVILPDIDPHPEDDGQRALKYSFADALGWSILPRRTITYRANGGGGEMGVQTVVAMDGLTAYVNLNANGFTPPGEGYYWNGWKDQDGKTYSNGQLIGVTKDLELTAQWSNVYTVVYRHTNHTNLYGSNETGHMECYALYINGELKPKFGTFADGSITSYQVPYGATIRVVVSSYKEKGYEFAYNDAICDVYRNGVSVARGTNGTQYTFALKNNVDIDFRWKIAGSLVTLNAQSWEDCYIEDK